jgi:hypothetical protein
VLVDAGAGQALVGGYTPPTLDIDDHDDPLIAFFRELEGADIPGRRRTLPGIALRPGPPRGRAYDTGRSTRADAHGASITALAHSTERLR